MELRDLLARRRMVRSFTGNAVDVGLLQELCASALWAPTAGNSAGVRMNIVAQPHVASLLHIATDQAWRERSTRLAGISRAGAAVLVTARVEDYLARYREDDKQSSGLGDRDNWPLPYWHTDAAMATMALLLLIEEAGLHATLWGSFRHQHDVLRWAEIVDEELFAIILLGSGDGNDVASKSLLRNVPSRTDRVRHISP